MTSHFSPSQINYVRAIVISLDMLEKSDWVIILPYRLTDHSVYVPSQWEMVLHCNAISHWLGTYTVWSVLSGLVMMNPDNTVLLNNTYMVKI